MTFNLFSSKKDIDFNAEGKKKFELVQCPLNHTNCKRILPALNEHYADSENFHRYKNFHKSIEALENAFYRTVELTESPCLNCAEFFRSTITQSVENIHSELESMSKGLFSTNRYQSSCEKAEQVLDEFKHSKRELKNAV